MLQLTKLHISDVVKLWALQHGLVLLVGSNSGLQLFLQHGPVDHNAQHLGWQKSPTSLGAGLFKTMG